jgi:hypothetical protein
MTGVNPSKKIPACLRSNPEEKQDLGWWTWELCEQKEQWEWPKSLQDQAAGEIPRTDTNRSCDTARISHGKSEISDSSKSKGE